MLFWLLLPTNNRANTILHLSKTLNLIIMPPKKILIILIILLILVIGTLVIYNFGLKKEVPLAEEKIAPEEEILPGPKKEIKPSPAAQIKAISQEPVLAPTTDGQKVKYYLVSNGNVFESNFDGSDARRISSNTLQGLSKIIWSPDKTKVIGIFQENDKIKKYLYDYQTRQSTLLNENIQWLTFSPWGDKIAYQYYHPLTEDNSISLANPDGSNWQNIFPTRMKDLIVEWPSLDQISIRTRPSGLSQGSVSLIDSSTGHFKTVLTNFYGLSALWSPLANKILFSSTDSQGKNLKLKIADKNGQIINNLDIVTLPEKCVWGQDERALFCAVPRLIPERALLPDDYYKGLFALTDDFYKINLETNQKSLLIRAEEMTKNYDATQLLLDTQEKYLFFVNQKDGLLYGLKLP